MPHISKIDKTLDLLTPGSPDLATPAWKRTEYVDPGHTVRSRSLRLRVPLLSLLPSGKMLMSVALVGTVVWVFSIAGRELDVEPRDRTLVTSASSIAELSGDFSVQADSERWRKLREWGGGETVEYSYFPPDPTQPRIHSFAWTCETIAEAKAKFRSTVLNTVIDWQLVGKQGVGLVELDENDPWADDSRVFRVELGRALLGYSVTLRQGRTTIYATLRGLELSDFELRRAIQPILRAAAQTPGAHTALAEG